MTKYLFTLIFAAAMISAATAQRSSNDSKKAIQEAITYAGSVAFVHTDKKTGGVGSLLLHQSPPHNNFGFLYPK
jgi:hypothetical protein